MGWDDEIENGYGRPSHSAVSSGDQSVQKLADDVSRFHELVSNVENVVSSGGGRMTDGQRNSLKINKEEAKQLARAINQQTSKGAGPNVNKRMFEKLTRDFGQDFARFKNLLSRRVSDDQREIAQARHRASSFASVDSEGVVTANPVQQQAMASSYGHAQAVTEEMLIREKNEELHELERDLGEINALMKDVNTLVNEQQEMIDTIETNVGTTAVQVEKGNEELRRALKHQKKSRKRMCCLATLLLIIAIAMALAFGLKK